MTRARSLLPLLPSVLCSGFFLCLAFRRFFFLGLLGVCLFAGLGAMYTHLRLAGWRFYRYTGTEAWACTHCGNVFKSKEEAIAHVRARTTSPQTAAH